MQNTSFPNSNDETKIVIACESCHRKLRIPLRHRKILVTCPTCQYEFTYQYYTIGLSSRSKEPMLVGFMSGLLGFLIVEIILIFLPLENHLLAVTITACVYGVCLGIVIESVEGALDANRDLFLEGLRVGSLFGVISGLVSGLVSQLVFCVMLNYFSLSPYPLFWHDTTNIFSPIEKIMLARTISWALLGCLTGLVYGFKEKNRIILKYGVIYGSIAGAIGGFFFELLSTTYSIGDGLIGRLFGFILLGMAIGAAFFQFKVVRIRPLMKSGFIKNAQMGSLSEKISLQILGGVLIILGTILVIGNRTGQMPTLPFAGFITSCIGVALLSAARKK